MLKTINGYNFYWFAFHTCECKPDVKPRSAYSMLYMTIAHYTKLFGPLSILYTRVRICGFAISVQFVELGSQDTKEQLCVIWHFTFFEIYLVFLLCSCVFCVRVCMRTTCVQWSRKPEEGSDLIGTGVTDSCQPPCRSWESNPGPLEEQSVLLTAETSFQPLIRWFLCLMFITHLPLLE